MESQMVTVVAVLLVVLAAVSSAQPAESSMLQSSDMSADKRPKYMDTRELDLFKDLLLSTIREMADDGQINPAVLPNSYDESAEMPEELKSVAKRMQYMGICMRRRHNTFIPYPCLRSGSQ